MRIDFHTHVFPDRIAEKTIELLAEKGSVTPFSDGTVAGLLRRMKDAEVDLSVNLPVLTSPKQFDSVNHFAAELNATSCGILSFAGIHPLCEDVEGKMKWIRAQGFLGVKIHPDYQETYIDDESYVRILSAAKDQDLIVVTHAGVDAAYPSLVRCPPERVLRLIRRVGHKKFVLAHYGGNRMFDQVLDLLCGEDVYFDTSYILRSISKETFLKILQKHGDDRILFGSDSPWSDMQRDVEILRSFNLPNDTEQKLFCDNAMKLLGR